MGMHCACGTGGKTQCTHDPGCSATCSDQTNASTVVMDIQHRDHHWAKHASYLWLESPAGVGFSYCDYPGGQPCTNNDTSTAADNHAVLKSFFSEGSFKEVGDSRHSLPARPVTLTAACRPPWGGAVRHQRLLPDRRVVRGNLHPDPRGADHARRRQHHQPPGAGGGQRLLGLQGRALRLRQRHVPHADGLPLRPRRGAAAAVQDRRGRVRRPGAERLRRLAHDVAGLPGGGAGRDRRRRRLRGALRCCSGCTNS
jgi:hypothetical protein